MVGRRRDARRAALDHYERRMKELDREMDRAQLEGRGDYETLGAMVLLLNAYRDELRKDDRDPTRTP